MHDCKKNPFAWRQKFSYFCLEVKELHSNIVEIGFLIKVCCSANNQGHKIFYVSFFYGTIDLSALSLT